MINDMGDNYYLKKSRPLYEEQKENALISALLFILVIFMAALLFFVSFFKLCIVDGSSMENSFFHDDAVLVYKNSSYKRFDVIIIYMEADDKNLIKRIVALENETFKFDVEKGEYHLYIKNTDGDFIKQDDENYIKEKMSSYSSKEFVLGREYKVPSGCFLFLGDNRNISLDSRHYGFGKNEQLTGRVVYKAEQSSFPDKVLRFIFRDKHASN